MKRGLRIAFQVLSLLLFALIVWQAGPAAAEAVLQGDRQALLAALLLYGVAGVASAARLRVVAHSLYPPEIASRRQFFQLNWVARSFGLVLPRTLSAVGGKSAGLHSFGVPVKRAVWIVLVDNLFDVFLLALLTVPAFLFFRGRLLDGAFVAVVIVVILLAGMAVWWGASDKWAGRLVNWGRRIPFLACRLNMEDEQAVVIPRPNEALSAFGWTVLLNAVLTAGFYFMAQAVGFTADGLIFFAAYPFVQLSLIAAVTPGGLGIFDLGWLGLLALGGVAEGDALTFVVAQRAYVALFVLIWTGFSILLGLNDRQRG